MDINEKRTISNELKHFTDILQYGDSKIQLLGSGGLKSQQNFSDYDLFCHIPEVIYDTFVNILNRAEDDANMYLIEIKFQNTKTKIKCKDIEDFIMQKEIFENMKIDMVKFDFVTYVDYKLVELSIIYNYSKLKTNLEKKLKEDIKEYKKEGMYYKALKREFSLLNNKRKKKEGNTLEEKRLLSLSKFFNSHFGGLYVVVSNLEAIKLMIKNYDDKRAKKMVQLNLKSLGVKQDKIDVVLKELKKLFNDEAKTYL